MMTSNGKWIITRRYDTYHELTHTGTGSMRKVMLMLLGWIITIQSKR